ncbi:unnamed protein product [Periconia digitata]|uniref:KAR9-domain-containing protein n=1 Tax=Periconia digitata TaxID=1303443 RepID=A0A9W4UF42_9PLEO|nr:unnamed protein product [Periconia digitata]
MNSPPPQPTLTPSPLPFSTTRSAAPAMSAATPLGKSTTSTTTAPSQQSTYTTTSSPSFSPAHASAPSPAHRPPTLSPSASAPNSTPTPTHTPPTATSSAGTSPRPDRTATSNALESSRKLARNVSPGLLARMKFLNQGPETPARLPPPTSQIGRISEHKIRELDDFHRDRTVRIERRGTTWNGSVAGSISGSVTGSQVSTPLIPQLTGESVPALAMDQSPASDRSSLVSTSDKVLPSDSEAGENPSEDTQKYRLPDITKTKSLTQSITESPASSEAQLTRPPTPPPKDSPPLPQSRPEEEPSVLDGDHGINIEAYFQRRHFSRANSIYTLSRLSFTNQIQQLTSINLPPPHSLSSEISALPSSTAAARALHGAANSIRLWMAKASEVLNGLDAEDDVEWAAAAGREGLAEVDAAIGKFEGLVNVYITAIEDLQGRSDIASLPTRDLTTLVTQMEEVVSSWSKIKRTLKDIKAQVEIAMEWEELWNIVLGEIGLEVENLSRLVFEMEERRHRAISDSVAESAEKFDIAELETIVEETPRQQAREQARLQSNRFSMPNPAALLSPVSPIPQIEQENSRLLSLFAKLQPLRASLDFLPMRLSSFQMRASKIFPSACEELTRRKEQLENLEKKLEADADALREELGEDKWVHSFRQAASKATAMYESLMKSMQRLKQAINENDDDKLNARVSTYKDRREHYPPAMKRVLQLIDIEMKHRSTVNGEILRIQQDVRQKVSDLEVDMQEMDIVLEEITTSHKLRDSVSTVLSSRTEISYGGSALDTPNSSPASSIIVSRKSLDNRSGTPSGRLSRQTIASSAKSNIPTNRRYSSLPMATGTTPRKSLPPSRLETVSPYPPRDSSSTPTWSLRSSTPSSERTPSTKPRWNSSTNMRDTIVGHNYKPLSLTTPSPHRKAPPTPVRTLRSVSSHSAIPVRSPLGRSSALSPPPHNRPSSTTPAQQASARRPLASPMQSPSTPARHMSQVQTTPGSSSLSTGTPSSSRRVQIAEPPREAESPVARRASRPASAMNSRRTSMLPTPKQRTPSGSNIPVITTPARASSRAGSRAGSRMGMTEDGRRSKMGSASGRQSSLETRQPWR